MELVVISGKGGTGKTTIVAALSDLAGRVMKVDCDVDAPNLYLFYDGIDLERQDFYGGKKAYKDDTLCDLCGACEKVCKFGAIKDMRIDAFLCEGCGACVIACPKHAILLEDEKTADAYITETEKGKISRAIMEIGSDGSGKLVTKLRKNAKPYVGEESLTILDGSPGIGCAVIASMTGVDAALFVTEPTKSGLNDLKRVVELSEHFDLLGMVCVNKYDINNDITIQIEAYAKSKNLEVVGKIPFDSKVMLSVNELRPITEYRDSIAGNALRVMWSRMNKILEK